MNKVAHNLLRMINVTMSSTGKLNLHAVFVNYHNLLKQKENAKNYLRMK